MRPPGGGIFTRVAAPVDTNFSETPLGSRVGTSMAHYLYVPLSAYIPLSFAWGDASVKEAAADGQITTVHYVDYEVLSILGVYVQLTVKVSGD